MNGDIALQLCQTADRIIPSCATGAQKTKGFWQLCVNSYANRKTILNSKFIIQNTVIKLHDRNPYDSEKILRSEKIVFRDMTLTENRATELIAQYLSDHPHINVLSDVHYAHITDERGRLIRYRSRDRYVFVESDFTPSLPTNTQIGQYNVRVKHPSQELYCYRCKSANLHRTNAVKECEAYNSDESSVEPFKADWNILNNFFVCHVVAFGRVFRSAEHAYQYRKCRDCLRNDLADKVIRAATPKKVKDIAAEIDPRNLDMWHKSNGHKVVMAEVLLAKARSNIDFKRNS